MGTFRRSVSATATSRGLLDSGTKESERVLFQNSAGPKPAAGCPVNKQQIPAAESFRSTNRRNKNLEMCLNSQLKKLRMWREEQFVLVTTGFLERGSGTRPVQGGS